MMNDQSNDCADLFRKLIQHFVVANTEEILDDIMTRDDDELDRQALAIHRFCHAVVFGKFSINTGQDYEHINS